MTKAIALDRAHTNAVGSYGTISIRIVVLRPKPKVEEIRLPEVAETSADEGLVLESGTSPLAGYMEKSAHGNKCVVFLVNGQRHDAWDNTFISRELGFKYLRTRTIIIVDLDGLSPEASSEVIQGSRQGLYEGRVFAAISDRMIATLKKDPDLTRLQTEAEQEISALQTGDEVVRQKLDELIDAHHAAGTHVNSGNVEGGISRGVDAVSFGKENKQQVVIEADPATGEPATLPVLVAMPQSETLRMRPSEERTLTIKTFPETAWATLENIDVAFSPKLEELSVSTLQNRDEANITFSFIEPTDFDEDEYPLTTTVRVSAKFKGQQDLRLLEREIVISRPRKARSPEPQPVLKSVPTFLRVVSRQPVKLISGGPSTHVRLKWDGEDTLAVGPNPQWSFSARCVTLGTFPLISFSQPASGRFELLLDTPNGLLAGQTLQFEIQAAGSNGMSLKASFSGDVAEIVAPLEPRRVAMKTPEPTAQRRPPYDLKYVDESKWDTPTCWGETTWSKSEVGAFSEPTDSSPLVLIINSDAEGVKSFRESLIRRNLDESTVRERVTRYTAHVAFHLYQLYGFKRRQMDAQADNENIHIPGDDELREEIQRVATTLIRLMEISR